MRYKIHNLGIETKDGHTELIRELAETYPSGACREKDGTIYRWYIPASTPIYMDSELAQKIFAILDKYGLHRRREGEERDRHANYYFMQKRQYGKRDLAVCEWFCLTPKMMIPVDAAMDDRHEGVCALYKKAAPKRISYCSINSGGMRPIYLGVTVKEALEKSDLTGHLIRPTLLKIRKEFVPNPEIWELASDRYFPDNSKMLPNPEPQIIPEEYHYRRSDIEHLRDVDVAYEGERPEDDGGNFSQMFASKRFYDWWLENNFKHLDFIPCRIVDE